MEELLFTAVPEKDYTTLIVLLITLAVLATFLVLVQTHKLKSVKGTYRQIALLLGGLTTLILLATTLFTAWNLHTLQPVKIYETYMESYHGKTPYKAIKRAGVFNDKQTSFINPQIQIRDDQILVVEKRDKKVMLFSADAYDVKKLVEVLHERM